MRSRCSTLAVLAAGFWAAGRGYAESLTVPASVTIVAATEIEAHRVAIEGIRTRLAKSSVEIRIVNLSAFRNVGSRADRLAAPDTRAIIAIGTEALDLVSAERPDVPVVSTMVLRGNAGAKPRASRPAATIVLDVPFPALLARLKQAFPGKTRLGIIWNTSRGGPPAAVLEARAQQSGFTVRIVDCPAAEQLLAAFLTLKGQVDFVWCLPDGALYNGATIRPLILASIENRLPLIGFSESFVRAGAAAGIYPDYRDIGLQTGEAAQQILSGQAVPASEGPRKLMFAVNQGVLRLLGLRYAPAATSEADFAVLQ